MKTSIIKIIIIIFMANMVLLPAVQAITISDIQNDLDTTAKDAGVINDMKNNQLTTGQIVAKIINLILQFAGALFLLLIMYAGFRWMSAEGKDEQVKQAKELITQAIVGLAIVLSSYLFANYIIFKIMGISLIIPFK